MSLVPQLVPMYGDAESPPQALGDGQPQSTGLLLLLGAGVAAATYYFKNKHEREDRKARDDEDEEDEEYDEEEEDEREEEDEEDDDDEPPRKYSRAPRMPKSKPLPEVNIGALHKRKKKSRFADATTDALLDEAAVIAGRGRKGDCYKAVRMLKGRAGLVKTSGERGLYARVARAVSADCAHADEEVEKAIEEEREILDEVEETFTRRGGSHKASAEAATQKWLDAEQYESGMRKSKSGREVRKTTVEHGDARAKGRSRPGRPGAVAVRVKKPSGESYKMRKEKAPTKRGYKWRKEEIE